MKTITAEERLAQVNYNVKRGSRSGRTYVANILHPNHKNINAHKDWTPVSRNFSVQSGLDAASKGMEFAVDVGNAFLALGEFFSSLSRR